MVVAHDNTADHDENTNFFGPADEQPQSVGPGRTVPASRDFEVERFAHLRSNRLGRRLDRGAADEGQIRRLGDPEEITIPVLTLLTDVDRVQKVRAGAFDGLPGKGAEIGNGDRFLRWPGEEQIADRHMDGARECFHLLRRGPVRTAFPFGRLSEPRHELFVGNPGSLDRLPEKFGLNGNTGHGTASIILSASARRISPDMSFGSNRSRVWAREADSFVCATMQSYSGRTRLS